MIAAAAFESEFQHPEMVQGFHDLLNLALKDVTLARVISIFQSSGWGKSRTICELHRQGVWVFYLTFTTGTGYPHRSPIADWFLGRVDELISADTKGHLACMVLFLAYMEACLEELHSIAPTTNQKDFVRMLYKSGEPGEDGALGSSFWKSVKERVEVLLEVYAEEGLDKLEKGSRQDCWTDWEERASKRVKGVVERLQKLLGNPDEVDEVKVVFVFDEGRVLVPEVLEKNVFLPLRRATSAFDKSTGIMTLLADTTPTFRDFSPPIWLDRANLRLAAPIWACFRADHGVDEDLACWCREHEIPLEDVRPLAYGRPLWWWTFKAQATAPAAICCVEDLARDKLLGGSGGWFEYISRTRPGLLTEAAALAVLGSRCAIDIDPHCSMVSDLVSSHLMTVVKVSEFRERIWAAFPMEPVVAEGAAQIMRELDRQERNRELYLPLSVALKAGWVHKGYKGELVARIIMLRAFDKAVEGTTRKWCTVDEFVKQLVGKSLQQLAKEQDDEQEHKVANKRRKQLNGERAEEKFLSEELKQVSEKKLCFNAFYKIGKCSQEITSTDIVQASNRGCAIVSDENTWGVDHFCPDVEGKVVVHQQVRCNQSDSGLADMGEGSPVFCGLPDTGPFLDLHMNLENVEGSKVRLVDPQRVERAVLAGEGKGKVLAAVLESRLEAASPPSADARSRARDAGWQKRQSKHPRRFKAWQDWLDMPRKNQVILKANGLGAFKPLLSGEKVFDMLAATIQHGEFVLLKEFRT